jgi:cold shock protein
MSQGNIKWFDKKKGYGFVDYEGSDVFLHYSEILGKYIPEDNDLISFEVIKGEKGLRAKEISKVG